MKEKEVFYLSGYGCYVMATAFFGNVYTPMSRFLKVLAVLILLCGILYDMRKIPVKEVVKNVLILGVIGIVGLRVNVDMVVFFLFIYAFRGCRFERLLKCDFVIRLAGFIGTNLLCILGLIPDNTLDMYRTSAGVFVSRHSMGYVHPNACFLMLFVIIVDYVLIRINKKHRITLVETGVLLAVAFVYKELTDSRAGFILTTLFVVFVYVVYKFRLFEKHVKLTKILAYGSIICMIGSIALIFIYQKMPGLGTTINNLLTNRVSSMNYYWSTYGPSILGQETIRVSTADATAAGTRAYVLDNLYTNLIVCYGVVFSVIFIVLHIKTSLALYKAKEYGYLTVFFFFAVYGIVEGATLNIDYNYFMVMSAGILINTFREKKNLYISGKEVVC